MIVENQKNKVLLIEDEEALIEVLNKKLTAEGYVVTIARDGQEGLEKMRTSRPDLILLDIVMPRMDGFEVLENMRKEEAIADLPVIIISNSGQPVELSRAKELGAEDWLIKTEFDPQEVLDKVNKFLNKPSV